MGHGRGTNRRPVSLCTGLSTPQHRYETIGNDQEELARRAWGEPSGEMMGREWALRDWGVACGLACALALTEGLDDTRETTSRRAHDAARRAFGRSGEALELFGVKRDPVAV
jgi:hypothetical protein